LSIISDQFYLAGWIQQDLHKIEIAAKLFPLNRSIALGPAQFYVIKDEPSEKALKYIAIGLNYDPNAIDLLQSNFKYKYMMGKDEEALNAYQKLKKLAPDSSMVKLFSIVK
jgi:tetratricopeptide (TPR) repeat protein